MVIRDSDPNSIVARFAEMVDAEQIAFKRQRSACTTARQIPTPQACEAEAEAISRETARLLWQYTSNANAAASLWLIGRRWIEDDSDYDDPRIGARAMQRWVRAMLLPR
jgi:hypothetical protein